MDQKKLSDLLTAVDQIKAAFGAPGDYGYSTKEGKALYALYQARFQFSQIAKEPMLEPVTPTA